MDDLKMALTACMEEYDREIRQAVSQLRPGDGFMGLGRDPRREPCHLRFYESAGELVARAVREGLAPEAAAETARFLLTLSQAEGYHELTDPMREAAQGHVLTLAALGWKMNEEAFLKKFKDLSPSAEKGAERPGTAWKRGLRWSK